MTRLFEPYVYNGYKCVVIENECILTLIVRLFLRKFDHIKLAIDYVCFTSAESTFHIST
jgi:hypothetical protein